MNTPVASVIVPCRNVATTVEAAVEGVLASPLRELEVIAVDDGSSDGTLETLRALSARDPRVTVLTSEGRGVSAARNRGLASARGEFVFFLDADDTVEPDFYPKAVEAMRRDEADYCRVAHDRTDPVSGRCSAAPLKADYLFSSPEAIRERYLPCFFGYSFRQVRDWYGGAPLGVNHDGPEQGQQRVIGAYAPVPRGQMPQSEISVVQREGGCDEGGRGGVHEGLVIIIRFPSAESFSCLLVSVCHRSLLCIR